MNGRAESKRGMARDAERVPPAVLETLKAPTEEGNGQSLCNLNWTLPRQKQRLELRPGPSLELDFKIALIVAPSSLAFR